jgi:hypothetical protein
MGGFLRGNGLLFGHAPARRNADPPKRIGASIAQGSFKVIGSSTSGARACLRNVSRRLGDSSTRKMPDLAIE